jgi:Zn-dependent protease/CBS domain-containing protein
MFIKRFEIFKLLGFPIRIDVSWFIIVILLTWTLATGAFPHLIQEFAPDADMPDAGVLWTMGFLGAMGLFISVLLHELGHAVVARGYGISMSGITLFIFGGVAEMKDEPPSAKAEFWIAIAGPIVSVLLAVGLSLIAGALHQVGADITITVVVGWLGFINGILVVFNMLPAFPLDGGRVLRAILWAVRNDMRWATRITSSIGAAFGIAFIALGVLQFIFGNIIGGIWMAIIGLFLRGAAQMSYQHLLVRRALEGEPVRRFMKDDPVTVPPDITLADLVNEVIYRYYFKMYPVVDDGRLLGCISTRRVKEINPEEWPETRVGDVMDPVSEDNTIDVNDDSMRAMSRMSSNESSRLMVVDGDQLVGIIALKDLLRFLSLRIEMDDGI